MTSITPSELKIVLQNTFDACKSLDQGKLADYIPELQKVSPQLFAVSFKPWKKSSFTDEFHLGDASTMFSLQSTSKPFSYAYLLTLIGEKNVHKKIGVEPSGEAFNSIVELEKKFNRPYNPMINSGAIAVAGLLVQELGEQALPKTLQFFSDLAGEQLKINKAIFTSEKETAHRNRSIAHLLRSFNIIGDQIEEALDLYFSLCSIEVNTKILANMASHLIEKQSPMLRPEISKNVLSLMFTCGMYDTAGEWAFEVGLPAKSGVSGCLFVSVPKVGSLALYSPRINEHGHSVRSEYFVKTLVKSTGWHIFQA